MFHAMKFNFGLGFLYWLKKLKGSSAENLYPYVIETVAPPGSSTHGILQARTLEWVAIPFSRGSHIGIKPRSLALQADSLPSESPGKLHNKIYRDKKLINVTQL